MDVLKINDDDDDSFGMFSIEYSKLHCIIYTSVFFLRSRYMERISAGLHLTLSVSSYGMLLGEQILNSSKFKQ